jgi:hypothetical protein
MGFACSLSHPALSRGCDHQPRFFSNSVAFRTTMGGTTMQSKDILRMEQHNLDLFFKPKTRQNQQGRSTKPRKIQIQKAGGFYRARYEGRAINVIVFEKNNAAKQLKFFDPDGGIHVW